MIAWFRVPCLFMASRHTTSGMLSRGLSMDPLAGYRVTMGPDVAQADTLLFCQTINDVMVGAAIAMTDDHQAAPSRSRSTILPAGQYPCMEI